MTVLLDGKGQASGMNKEIILKGVAHDNGRVINNGPREVGTNKKGKIGVQHKDGPLVHRIEILDLNPNGETSKVPVNVIMTGANNHKPHRVDGKTHSRVINNNNNNKLLRLSTGLRNSNNNHSSNSCRLYRHLCIRRECNQ